jgi:hypothetical protein
MVIFLTDGMAPSDHIFDARGEFCKISKLTYDVKIQMGDKLYSQELNTSRGSRTAIAKIEPIMQERVDADAGTVTKQTVNKILMKCN